MSDEPEPTTEPTEHHEEHHEEAKERERWESRTRETLKVSEETLARTNQALDLQARRMDDLAKLHESQTQQLTTLAAETATMLKAAREMMAAADQARSELVSVTAALVKVAQVQQAMIQALQEESQS